MALVKYNDRSLRNLTTKPAAATDSPGALVHIKTLTASSSSTLSFVDGSDSVVLDNTYPIYKFEFINCHPATDGAFFHVNFRDGGSAYDAVKTTTWFRALHSEDDSNANLTYDNDYDLAQSTSAQRLTGSLGNGNDESISGELTLYNPSSTTFVKHFIYRGAAYFNANGAFDIFCAGYCNTATAIDGVQFSMSSGNIDAGQIKLYGIKDA